MNIKNLLLGPTKAEIKIVGVSNYTDTVNRLTEGAVIRVEHEPTNPYDSNAMKVTLDGETVGYVPKVIAERMVTEMTERTFIGHIVYTTHHEGNTVGGAFVIDHVGDMETANTATTPTVRDIPVF